MTIYDLRCDKCSSPLSGPAGPMDGDRAGIRFDYHPGRAELGDTSGLMCRRCWDGVVEWLGEPATGRCADCDADLRVAPSLFLHRHGDLVPWRLCRSHAVAFLNGLRTVEPKLDPDTFHLPGPPAPSADVSIRPRRE